MNARLLVRLEGALVGGGAAALYAAQGRSPLFFVALVLAPDLSILGYRRGKRVGAATYNAAHTYLGPGLLAAVGVLAAVDLAVALALVWTAHIGADRLFGLGLKYADREFGDTHIQRL